MAGWMPQACERCHRRKQKCDRQRPQCSKCHEVDATCVERRMGQALDPLKLDEHHSVEALERRVEHLRELVERKSSSESHVDLAATPPTARSHGRTERHSSATAQNPAVDGMRYLPLSALTEVKDRGTSENRIGFSTLLAAALVAPQDRSADPEPNILEILPTDPQPDSQRLPRPFVEKAIQTYSHLCDAHCPFIKKSDLAREMERFVSASPLDDALPREAGEKIIFKLAVATSIFLLKRYRLTEHLVPGLVEQAKRSLPRAMSNSDGALEVQCILAMAVLSNYSVLVGSMWHLVGLAISRCFSFGLHTFDQPLPEDDRTTERVRLRTFVSVYILDTTMSSTLDRPFSVRDQDMATLSPDAAFTGQGSDMCHVTLQQALLLRTIRNQPASGAIFHLANFEYWKELSTHMLSDSEPLSALLAQRLSSQLLLGIVHAVHRSEKPDEVQVLAQTVQNEYYEYLTTLQRRSHCHEYALSYLDAIDVFAIGVSACYLGCSGMPSLGSVAVSRPTRICIELLNIAAERFSDARSLAELLGLLVDYVVTRNRGFALDLNTALHATIDSGVCLPDRDRQFIQTILSMPNSTSPLFSTGT